MRRPRSSLEWGGGTRLATPTAQEIDIQGKGDASARAQAELDKTMNDAGRAALGGKPEVSDPFSEHLHLCPQAEVFLQSAEVRRFQMVANNIRQAVAVGCSSPSSHHDCGCWPARWILFVHSK